MTHHAPTRGFGLLERYLSRQRARRARQALKWCPRRDALLDIGCGMHSEVLQDVSFRERYALDQIGTPPLPYGVRYTQQNLADIARFPFRDAAFSAVTMLAVIEHVPFSRVAEVCQEIYRVLVHDGVLFLTTPRPGTDTLLRLMARVHVVSREEIAEHRHEYGFRAIRSLLLGAGFSDARIRHGTFLCGLNTWTCAQK